MTPTPSTSDEATALDDPENAPLSQVQGTAAPTAAPTAVHDERTVHILQLLEKGFLTDSSRFRLQEAALKATLQQARSFGAYSGSPDDWNQIWSQRWDHVEIILLRISDLVGQMDDSISSNDRRQLEKALTSWEAIEAEDVLLSEALGDLRTQAYSFNPGAQKNWNELARTLEKQVNTIHSCSQALWLKLELLKEHSKTEVDQMLNNLVAQLPSRTAASAVAYSEDYDQAVVDLQREQHQSLGFLDVLKTMFMWTESPQERLNKNRRFHTEPV